MYSEIGFIKNIVFVPPHVPLSIRGDLTRFLPVVLPAIIYRTLQLILQQTGCRNRVCLPFTQKKYLSLESFFFFFFFLKPRTIVNGPQLSEV